MAINKSKTHKNASKADGSRAKSGAMTPQEAGHLGGIAPHSCRGFQCQQKSSSRKASSSRSNKGY